MSQIHNNSVKNENKNPNYYLIAGEASGDLHGSNLILALKLITPNANFRCWGGDKMQAAGATIVKHYKDLAFMGFVEVIKNLKTIFKNIAFCKQDILANKPTAIILIDYPGFNLRIAKWAKKQGIKVIYYISPQVWAWKESRVKNIKKYVDKMLVILPFEKQFYQKWNYQVDYVGHPLAKVVADFKELNFYEKTNIIALLPGSRKQEILTKLPIMLKVAEHFSNFQFIVAKAPGLENDFYKPLLAPYKNVSCVLNETYALLCKSSAALVTSGTATLETALFGVPQIICYKGSNISYTIAKKLIKIKYIGLVNLIMDKPVVKELIQHELTEENLVTELTQILNNKDKQAAIQKDYIALNQLLSAGGNASKNAAQIINHFINPNF